MAYTFAITAGALPPGLTMNTSGHVSGIVQGYGTFAFTVQVTDSLGATASVNCTIPVPRPKSSVGGGCRLVCRPSNAYDHCLDGDAERIRKIKLPPLCTIPPKWRECLPWSDSFGAYPSGAVPWRLNGSILTPDPSAGNVVLATDRAPIGYDLLITGFLWNYTGGGFDQGNGDIAWRVRKDLHYIEGWGSILYQMGSTETPAPAIQGNLVYSGQTVALEVQVYNLSGNIQIGTTRVFAGLLGFWWPRGGIRELS